MWGESMTDNRNRNALYDDMLEGHLSRRTLLKRAALLGLTAPTIAGLLAACGGDDDDDDAPTEAPADATSPPTGGDSTPESSPESDATEPSGSTGGGNPDAVRGGRLIVANASQPTSLDMHQTTGGRTVSLIGWHMYESLFTWDAQYALMPQLAEAYEASDDATVHTITLRQGVPFHNGNEMIAADVIASIERWGEIATTGKLLMDSVAEITEVDDYTIEITTSTPIATVPQLLARAGQGCAIYPKSTIDAVGTDFVEDYIGTGPYQFTDFQADRFTLLTRFPDYVGPEGEPSGYSGARNAYLDELEFRPVPDEGARVAGFQAGDFHYLEELVADQIESMKENPDLNVATLPPRSYGYIGLNHASGVFTDLKIRQAAQAAMDHHPQGLASHGEGFFELGPGIMLPVTVWDSDAGAELYNQNDPEKAKALLEEAGYDGTPVQWITTQEDLGDYNSAVVCQQQLEAAGFTVELVVVDEPTVATMRNEQTGWDAWNGAFILRTDPTLLQYLSSPDYSGFWTSPEKEEAFERLLTQTEFEDRYAAFEDLQRLFYEEVGGIKQQNNYGIMAAAAVLKNFGPETTLFELEPEFTNSWLEEA
jgi:peptide/nickel transport system substrate-binding protein